MTNPTCPHDHLECTPNNGPIDFDGYLNCGECKRYKKINKTPRPGVVKANKKQHD